MTATPRNILIPLDGSDAAERALPIAEHFATALGAALHVVVAAPDQPHADMAREYLDDLDHRLGARLSSLTVDVGPHPASVIRHVAGMLDAPVVCLATHARGRLGTAVLGSVADALVAASDTATLLVGPQAQPGPAGSPVVVCVDGSVVSEQALAPALGWAVDLGSLVTVVTVAEPVLASVALTGPTFRRLFGPHSDAEAYTADVASRFAGRGPGISGEAVYDPISPADGIASYLADHAAQLVVATAHATAGTQPFIGSTAAALVRHCPVPVLLQPIREERAPA